MMPFSPLGLTPDAVSNLSALSVDLARRSIAMNHDTDGQAADPTGLRQGTRPLVSSPGAPTAAATR